MGVGRRLIRRLQMLPGAALSALVPEPCLVCGTPLLRGERHLCLRCWIEMPRVSVPGIPSPELEQRVLTLTASIHDAKAMFRYNKFSNYSRLIKLTKYSQLPGVGKWLMRRFAEQIAPTGVWADVDCIVPVPMAWHKLLMRGYNQSRELALQVAAVTGRPVEQLLQARGHGSQTRHGVIGRLLNSGSVYTVRPKVKHRRYAHVLLVDDVMTTGATIVACTTALQAAWPGLRVSVAVLALAE